MEPGVYILHEKLKRFPPAQTIYIVYRRLLEHGINTTYLWVMDKILRRVKGFSPPGVSEVARDLYVGGQQKKHGLHSMRALGITAVVNMREESDDAEHGVELDHYLWLPVVDDAAPAFDELDRGSAFINKHISAGRGVYVHCASGVGRAPTMAVAYLVNQGTKAEDAWSIVSAGRPFIRPTPPQIQIIDAYAAYLAQHRKSSAYIDTGCGAMTSEHAELIAPVS
ncbi:MAG: dual specificity protein phosphatase [Anaerolineae bacterium]|nr:dual specificity protein phosphatase [Anaerolineae bacterium]